MAALTHGERLTRVQAGKLKVAELRKRLAGMGRSTDGLKQALVDRLIGALEEEEEEEEHVHGQQHEEEREEAGSAEAPAGADESARASGGEAARAVDANEGAASIVARPAHELAPEAEAADGAPADSVRARCNDDGFERMPPSMSTVTKLRGEANERTVQQQSERAGEPPRRFVAPTLKEYEEHRERLVGAGFTSAVFSPCSVTKPMTRRAPPAEAAVASPGGADGAGAPAGTDAAAEPPTASEGADEEEDARPPAPAPAAGATKGTHARRPLEPAAEVRASRLPLPPGAPPAAKGAAKRPVSAAGDRRTSKAQRNSTSARSFR